MEFLGPITKVKRDQRICCGYASTEAEDAQGEIVTRAAIAAALDDYMRFANVREMHALKAVGTVEHAEVDDKGLYIECKIVDRDAWEKVVAKVYKGFSIGGRPTAREKRKVTGLELYEISLVDRPANPEALIERFKADGGALIAKAAGKPEPLDEDEWQQLHDRALQAGAQCGEHERRDPQMGGDDIREAQRLHDLAQRAGATCLKDAVRKSRPNIDFDRRATLDACFERPNPIVRHGGRSWYR